MLHRVMQMRMVIVILPALMATAVSAKAQHVSLVTDDVHRERLIFEAAARYFAGLERPSTFNPDAEVAVDPWPLVVDVDLFGYHDGVRDSISQAERAARVAFLNEAGIDVGHVAFANECRFAEGLPAPPVPDDPMGNRAQTEARERLQQQCAYLMETVTIALSYSRSGRPYYPLDYDGERRKYPDVYRIVRVLSFTTSSAEVYDLVLRPENGTWTVVDQVRLAFSAS